MSSRRPPSSSSPNRPSRLGEVVVKWGRWCVVEVEEGVVGGGGGCGGGCGGGDGAGDDGGPPLVGMIMVAVVVVCGGGWW